MTTTSMTRRSGAEEEAGEAAGVHAHEAAGTRATIMTFVSRVSSAIDDTLLKLRVTLNTCI